MRYCIGGQRGFWGEVAGSEENRKISRHLPLASAKGKSEGSPVFWKRLRSPNRNTILAARRLS